MHFITKCAVQLRIASGWLEQAALTFAAFVTRHVYFSVDWRDAYVSND